MRTNIVDTGQIEDNAEFRRWGSVNFANIDEILRSISFNDNFDGNIVSVSFSSANADTAVSHNLNRIPSGYIELSKSVAMIVYTGSSTWTTSTIYLKSSAVGTASLLIF